MHTLTTVLARHQITVPDDLIADITIPVLTVPQRQGDVAIFHRPTLGAAERKTLNLTTVPATGVAVVRGEGTGNTHILSPEPGTTIGWALNPNYDGTDDLVLGVLDVPEGAVAWLIHTDEHGANGIGAGTYVLRGKREQRDIIERVAD